MNRGGSPVHILPPVPSLRRVAPPCPRRLAHTKRTALIPNQPLGSAQIVHPFHPLRGQQFAVLKARTVSGIETLCLHHKELGSLAVPRDWTDWAPPGSQALPGEHQLVIDAWSLIALAELTIALRNRDFYLDRGIGP